MDKDTLRLKFELVFSRRQVRGALFLALIFGFALALRSDTMKLSTYYPAPSGVYKKIITTTQTILARDTGNVGIGTTSPNPSKGNGYLDVRDVYLRDALRWASEGSPKGAVQFFNLSKCPPGWSEFAAARGRYLVGLTLGGALAAAVGTPLSDREERPAGRHSHTLTGAKHTHSFPVGQDDGKKINGAQWEKYNNVGTTVQTSEGAFSGSTDESGTGATNAPYLQLLACQKD